MQKDESLNLTDGKGNIVRAFISDPHKKHCRVVVEATGFRPAPMPKVIIGISLLKNSSRFEWFLEKAAELGINEIIPLLCERTEKEKFRQDRLEGILTSAMLQSEQCWKPVLHSPIDYELLFRQEEIATTSQKFIAHCLNSQKMELNGKLLREEGRRLILIGPEGDFSEREIEMALSHDFIPVSLGNTRLRTETAGMVAATILRF